MYVGGGDYQTKFSPVYSSFHPQLLLFFRLSEPFTRLWSAVKDEFLL